MKNNQLTISHLINRIYRYNDEEAFEKLFKLYYSRLLHFSFLILKNNELAEDVVLEVFAVLWEKREKIAEIKQFNNYLYISVKNRSLDKIKKFKELITLDGKDQPMTEQIIYQNPENQVLNDELLAALNGAILNLPERCRLVYRLIKEDGLKYKEVAELLDISVKTVDNHLSLAMNRIRIEVAAYLNGEKNYQNTTLKLVK